MESGLVKPPALPVSRRKLGWMWQAGLAATAFVVLFVLTVPDVTADTPVYVSQIFNFYKGGPSADPKLLWEFGHLLWRPMAYPLWRVLSPALSSWSGGNPYLEITAVLVGMNFVAGLSLSIVLFFTCRKLALSNITAFAVTLAFLSTSTILNYIHSGMSYNLGFALQVAGLLLILHACTTTRPGPAAWKSVFGGIVLGLSCAVWFPYVLTIPAPFVAGWFAGGASELSLGFEWRRRLKLLGIALVATAGIVVLTFGIGAWIDHISSIAGLRQWVLNSAHGVAPQHRLIRLPTGVTRSFLYFGDDGILFKRFTMGDPYAPVHFGDLVQAGLWKILAVFLVLLAFVVTLAGHRKTWPALAVVMCAALPCLGFAVLLFDTSEPARYEPAYAALLVGVCAVLLLPRNARIGRWCLAGFAAAMFLVNWTAYGWTLRKGTADAIARVNLIHEHAASHDTVFLLSFRDPISTFVQKAPFSRYNRPNTLALHHAIEPGSSLVLTWRHDAACRMLNTWKAGGQDWISDRLVAQRPLPSWNWAEHDDDRVHWTDVSNFFAPLDRGEHIGGSDGFFLLPDSQSNRDRLAGYCSPH
ncbi:MAG TPA: hypothetical protein VHZ07_26820 [Bryobacteraceae bacterium]|jgi:hypothetical protein|nr:hypothetical protein [Bryobacteraceae bacterium]